MDKNNKQTNIITKKGTRKKNRSYGATIYAIQIVTRNSGKEREREKEVFSTCNPYTPMWDAARCGVQCVFFYSD